MAEVSIILAVLNGANDIHRAITSVQNQTLTDWELLVVDNGSTDSTRHVVASFDDPRICVLTCEQRGVSHARNVGIAHAKSDCVCFLDHDDSLPPDSLSSRVAAMKADPHLTAVDGTVVTFQANREVHRWKGTPSKDPLPSLFALEDRHFRGITFLFRQKDPLVYFKADQTHGEDFVFLIDLFLTHGGQYGVVDEETYHIHQRSGSAMSDLQGLENGYRQMLKHHEQTTKSDSWRKPYIRRVRRIMFRSYAKKLHLYQALRAYFEWSIK